MNPLLTPTAIDFIAIAVAIFFGVVCYWALKEREYIKTTYYESHPLHSYHLTRFQSALALGEEKKTEAPLTKAEISVREILSRLKGDTLWHYAIDNALASKRDQDFRTLICQLKSEAEPVPETMKKILGAEVFEAVMAL